MALIPLTPKVGSPLLDPHAPTPVSPSPNPTPLPVLLLDLSPLSALGPFLKSPPVSTSFRRASRNPARRRSRAVGHQPRAREERLIALLNPDL